MGKCVCVYKSSNGICVDDCNSNSRLKDNNNANPTIDSIIDPIINPIIDFIIDPIINPIIEPYREGIIKMFIDL